MKEFFILSCIACYVLFLSQYGLTPLNSDDHPTFRYRMALLDEHFPNIPFYFPLWNHGIDQRDFFASGSIAFYLVSWPVFKIFGINAGFNIAVANLIFVINPLCSYFAAVLSGARSIAPLAGILALNLSLHFYYWAFKYGTLGFMTSLSLYPLSFIFLRYLFSGRMRRYSWLANVGGAFLVSLNLIWPLTGFALAPTVLYLRRRFFSIKSLVASAIIIICSVLWMPIFIKVSRVGSFVSKSSHFQHLSSAASDGGFALTGLINNILHTGSEFVSGVNPIILFSILLLLIRRNLVAFYLVTLGLVGSYFKPQLELTRMFLYLSSLANMHATVKLGSRFINWKFKIHDRKRAFAWIMMCVVIIATPLSVISIVTGKSIESPKAWHQNLGKLIGYLTNSNSGNVMFTGVVLHQYGGGHIAPYALETKRRMLASSYVHNKWNNFDIVPDRVFERGSAAVERYFQIHDVSTIVTHVVRWQDYLDIHPHLYRLSLDLNVYEKRIRVYERIQYEPSYTALGQVKDVKFGVDRISMVPLDEAVIIKSSYFSYLEVDGCESLAPHRVRGIEEPVIMLRGCTPGKRITISMVSPWRRLWL